MYGRAAVVLVEVAMIFLVEVVWLETCVFGFACRSGKFCKLLVVVWYGNFCSVFGGLYRQGKESVEKCC